MGSADMKDDEIPWNDGYWTEGFDRIYNVCQIADMLLTDHPAIIRANLEDEVIDIINQLNGLYQKLGDAEHENDRL